MERIEADLVLVGGGGAATCVLQQLALARMSPRKGRWQAQRSRLRIVVVDPVDRLVTTPDDRTWSFWSRRDRGVRKHPFADRTWPSLMVAGPERVVDVELGPTHDYHMVRSSTFYALVGDLVRDPAAGLSVRHVPATAGAVLEESSGVTVHAGGARVHAPWVLTSAPLPGETPPRPRTALWQHFHGAVVRTERRTFDPDQAVLMDLRVPQPRQGVGFGYLLPVSSREALVEYTVLAPGRADPSRLQAGLDAYLAAVGAAGATVVRDEHGSIPMTDAKHRRRIRFGGRVFRIGTVGGATRPSTGYTFAAMQRQAAGVAEALLDRTTPVPPRAYPRRHLMADSLLLRGLASGEIDGTRFFPLLFERNPPARVLDFLDGLTTPAQDLALVASVPPLPMLRAAVSAGRV